MPDDRPRLALKQDQSNPTEKEQTRLHRKEQKMSNPSRNHFVFVLIDIPKPQVKHHWSPNPLTNPTGHPKGWSPQEVALKSHQKSHISLPTQRVTMPIQTCFEKQQGFLACQKMRWQRLPNWEVVHVNS